MSSSASPKLQAIVRSSGFSRRLAPVTSSPDRVNGWDVWNIQGRDNDKAAVRRRYKTYRLHAARRIQYESNPLRTQTRLPEAAA